MFDQGRGQVAAGWQPERTRLLSAIKARINRPEGLTIEAIRAINSIIKGNDAVEKKG